MKRVVALAAVCILMAAALSGCYVRGGSGRYSHGYFGRNIDFNAIGDVIYESYDESGYTSVELRYIDMASIARGKTPVVRLITGGEGVSINANEGLLDEISVYTSGERLIIEGDRYKRYAFDECVIEIGVSGVDNLMLNGPFEVEADGAWSGDSIRLQINGAAQCGGLEVAADKLRFDINGASEFVLEGAAEDVRITINGASDIRAFNLDAVNADININGAGTCEISVSDELDVSIAGVGTVRYKGSPDLKQSIAGLGSVSRQRD